MSEFRATTWAAECSGRKFMWFGVGCKKETQKRRKESNGSLVGK